MKRIQEKVKDLVEVRSYQSLQNFQTDPAQTLAAYYFTDFTSEMMTKWIDKLARVQSQNGVTQALAGYRGVGKSHFLSTFGAIVSQPELRSRVTDPLVASSAQRLKRRRHPVVHVRRGTHPTLLEEFKEALASTLEVNASNLSDSIGEMLRLAAEKAGDLPFVIIIDTAFDRAARVAREDGLLLGEMAEHAKNLNVFIAVALDDDIAGADGVNASIARNFTIDYLDQEHLYRIVDSHIFPKHRHMQRLIHEIYDYFRALMPSFRWSQERFASLYPLHPLILEIAPFVRLYAPEFALLGFASVAGARILGRPANSLVGLDEVFDTTEAALRKAENLRETFSNYDRLNNEIIAQIPVMQRLQAKLVLKALLLLSLDGEGTTASEISAAMLIYDENVPQHSINAVRGFLETFASALPDAVYRREESGREVRFSFAVSGKDSLNVALSEAALGISSEVIPQILRRFAGERFPDWILPIADNASADTTSCQIVWRGGCRRGRVTWSWCEEENASSSERESDYLDWQIRVSSLPPASKGADKPSEAEIPTICWQAAPLRPDEVETILRYSVLINDTGLRDVFGEQVRAVGNTLTMAVEKIWNRIFLENAQILINGTTYELSERAKNAHTLAEVLSEMLEPVFDARYPEHPIFADVLDMDVVSQLVADLYTSPRQTLPDVQQMAASYAAPLGLVTLRGSNLFLDTDENLLHLPMIQEVLALVNEHDSEVVPLDKVDKHLKREPYGLVREAQHLILAALVARRRIEFVTSQGDRINRRSLDLKIVWDDIVGIARPSSVSYSSTTLTEWARILTAVDTFRSIDDPEDRRRVHDALALWLAEWQKTNLLERFEQLPEETLNTRIWRLSTSAQKSFGLVAATVEEFLNERVSLEECLQRIADAFSNSEKEFLERSKDLLQLEDFTSGAASRQKAWQYLSLCEITEDENIEKVRAKLVKSIRETSLEPSEVLNREQERLWHEFQLAYTEHFALKHDSVMKAHDLKEKFDQMMRSDEWWEFENLSTMPIFQKNHWRRAEKICRRFKALDCRLPVRELLGQHPFCNCTFRLSQMKEWENLPQDLAESVQRGRACYRKTLKILSETLVPLLEFFGGRTNEVEYAEAAFRLADVLKQGSEIPLLSTAELIMLEKTIQAVPSTPLLQAQLPSEQGFLTREELRQKLSDWLDELPSEPALVKI